MLARDIIGSILTQEPPGARGATCIATPPAPSLPSFIKPGVYTGVCTPLPPTALVFMGSGKAALY